MTNVWCITKSLHLHSEQDRGFLAKVILPVDNETLCCMYIHFLKAQETFREENVFHLHVK